MWTVVIGARDAVAEMAGGACVVVVVAPGEATDLPVLRRAGRGRVALYLGDPGDPATLTGAAEMAAELGGRPAGE